MNLSFEYVVSILKPVEVTKLVVKKIISFKLLKIKSSKNGIELTR